jgi:DNA repair protein RecO
MTETRTLGIVLRSLRYQERDRIVTWITGDLGRITTHVKNAVHSRRFGGTLEPLIASDLVLRLHSPHAELFQLESTSLRKDFGSLGRDLSKFGLATAFSDLLLRVAPEREQATDLLKLHSNALTLLEEMTSEPSELLVLLTGYLAKILQWAGHQPLLQRCQECSKGLEEFDLDSILECSWVEARWTCPNCSTRRSSREGTRLPARAIWQFYQGMTKTLREVQEQPERDSEALFELYRLLIRLMIYHLPNFGERPLAGLDYVDPRLSNQFATSPKSRTIF